MLELYQAEGCGYSQKVREMLTVLGVSYVIHNPHTASGETRNEQTHNELRTLGGQDQNPFLIDHQRRVTMYESDDIDGYLENHYAGLTLSNMTVRAVTHHSGRKSGSQRPSC